MVSWMVGLMYQFIDNKENIKQSSFFSKNVKIILFFDSYVVCVSKEHID